MFLSKSQFLRGMQCQKSLWLKKHKSEVLSQPDESALAKFKAGNEVGELACELFKGGVKIEFENSDFAQKIQRTKELIESGVKVIYEATFAFDDILVMVDILEIVDSQNSESSVIINEVKSSTSAYENSKPKDVYLQDLGIQYFVLNNLGYKIKGANLICLNSAYVKNGALDLQQLFIKNDLLDSVKAFQAQIPAILQDFKRTIENPNEPNIDIGAHCSSPYECDCAQYCWETQRGLSGRNNVFGISRLSFETKMRLYKAGQIALDKIDLNALNASQQLQVKCALQNKTHIDKAKIKEFLSSLKYPIYHLDFETFQQVVPKFDGVRAYEQIVFQYSVHKDFGDSGLEHSEFLAQSGVDERLNLARSLVRDIPQDSCVLAYNAAFEKGIIRGLASHFENLDSELARKLMNIHDHILDLMIPFKDKSYYDPKMQGSYSIKFVLPALCADFENAYKNLELVHNGIEAMEAYGAMEHMSQSERAKYRKALLEYCKLDTLAMVQILKVLENAVND